MFQTVGSTSIGFDEPALVEIASWFRAPVCDAAICGTGLIVIIVPRASRAGGRELNAGCFFGTLVRSAANNEAITLGLTDIAVSVHIRGAFVVIFAIIADFCGTGCKQAGK